MFVSMFGFSSGKLRSRARGRRGLITRGRQPREETEKHRDGVGVRCWGWASPSAQDHPARPSGWPTCWASRQMALCALPMENADSGSSKPASVVEHGTQFAPRTGDFSCTPAVSPATPSSGSCAPPPYVMQTQSVGEVSGAPGCPHGGGWVGGGEKVGVSPPAPIPNPAAPGCGMMGGCTHSHKQGGINLGRLIAYPNIVGNLHR